MITKRKIKRIIVKLRKLNRVIYESHSLMAQEIPVQYWNKQF